MSKKPPLLPEQPRARDTQPTRRVRPLVTYRRGSWIILWLALIILSISFFGSAWLVLNRPDLLELERQADIQQTQAVFDRTAIALDATAQAVQVAANGLELTAQFNASQSFDNDSTRVALDNAAFQLEQAGTQAALDAQATQTTVAIVNAQGATQAAVDFQNTQVAFDRAATQVELAYQGTQAALNRDATAAALGFATEAPPAQDVLPSLPPPTLTAQPLFTDGFDAGLDNTRWDVSAIEDWTLTADGALQSERSGGWLLTQQADFSTYSLNVELLPRTGAGLGADYHILLNAGSNPDGPDGVAVRVSYDGTRVTAVGLHPFSLEQVYLENGLLNRPLAAITSQQVEIPAAETIALTIDVNQGQIQVWVDRINVIDTALEAQPPGSIGVQVPVGAAIAGIALR